MQAPLTIKVNSPLELVQQFFVKLGARYVVITDADGYCEFCRFPLFFDGDRVKVKTFRQSQMRASLTKIVGSPFLASWRQSQAS